MFVLTSGQVFVARAFFRVHRKSRTKSAREPMGEHFSIKADQPIDDDFSSSDGASAIVVGTKSLLLCLVGEDIVLLWELESFWYQTTSFCVKTRKFHDFCFLIMSCPIYHSFTLR